MSTPTYDSAADITALQTTVRNLNAVLHQFNNSEGALSPKDEATLQAAISIGQTLSTQAEVMHAFVTPNQRPWTPEGPRHNEAAFRQARGIDATRPLNADERAAFEGSQPVAPSAPAPEIKQPVAPFPFGYTEAQFRSAHRIDPNRALTAQEQAQFEAQRKNPKATADHKP